MLLFGLLLLTSALAGQTPGTQAESNLSSKFQFSSNNNKEQNGESGPPPSTPLSPLRGARRVCVPWAPRVGARGTPARQRGLSRLLLVPVRALGPVGTGWRRMCVFGDCARCHKAAAGWRGRRARPCAHGEGTWPPERWRTSVATRVAASLAAAAGRSRAAFKKELEMNEAWPPVGLDSRFWEGGVGWESEVLVGVSGGKASMNEQVHKRH